MQEASYVGGLLGGASYVGGAPSYVGGCMGEAPPSSPVVAAVPSYIGGIIPNIGGHRHKKKYVA